MENSAQDASYSAQEASDSAQDAIDTEMSALSITGVSEDKSMSGVVFGPVQCEDQENTLYGVLLHRNSNGNLEVVGLRKEKETGENDTLDKHVSKTLSELLMEQDVFKWLDENPDSLKKNLEPLTEQYVFKWLEEHPDSLKKYFVMSQMHEKSGKFEQQKRQVFPDISSAQDHTDSKVFMTSAVRGSIHQASTQIFKHEAAGSRILSWKCRSIGESSEEFGYKSRQQKTSRSDNM